MFALECLNGLNGADDEALRTTLRFAVAGAIIRSPDYRTRSRHSFSVRVMRHVTWLLGTCLAGVFLLSLAAPASGQALLRTWTTADGLPHNTVQSLVQTPDGYLWLATRDGLARFDGVRFRVFNRGNTSALPVNRIASLFVDGDGRLWISPEGTRVIVVHENGRFTALEQGVDFEADNLSEPQRAQTPVRFRSGDFEHVFDNGRFVRRPAEPRPRPAAVVSDDRSGVRIDTSDPHAEIDGAIWFFMARGDAFALCRMRDGELTVSNIVRRVPSLLEKDRSGHLWLADGQGVERIDAGALRAPDLSQLRPETVTAGPLQTATMFSDRDANLWVGTERGLHLVHDDPVVTVYSRSSGLPSDNVYPIVEDRTGAIWFGAWNGHVIRYAGGRFSATPMGFVTALATDHDDRVWIAASRSLAYRDGGRWIPMRVPGFDLATETSVIAQDRDGHMWFGNGTGLARVADGSAEFFTTEHGLPGNVVTSFLQTASGAIWVGTTEGLAQFENGRWVAFTEKRDGLAGNFIRSLYEDRDGTVWIGTYDSGLTRYAGGRFSTITSRHGLFSDGVFCLLEDDGGWFWMHSNQGIYRARRDELNAFADGRRASVTSVSYGPEDGLVNVEGNGGKQPACARAADGRLWFATAGGLAVVDPRRARQVSTPRVVIEDHLIDGRETEAAAGTVRIEPGERSLEIRYTALNFRGAERIRFRYRLEGLEEHWTEAGTRRFASFSHLPSGDYTFRVVAADHNGVWHEQGATARIVVVAPFYRTAWFYALCAAGGLMIAGFAYSYRVAQLQALNRVRAEYTRRLIQSEEGERRRLALELHDSIGQSLAVIRNRALISLRTPSDHERLLEQMEEISEASAMAAQETRQIALNLHPAQLDHLGLSTALASLVASVESGSHLTFQTNIDDVSGRVTGDAAIGVYRIVQESLSNVIKHSAADSVEVSLQVHGKRVQLLVSDNGRGFSTPGPVSGLGLTGMRERAAILGADLRIESAPGRGTRIVLSLSTRDADA
jgi:signal transduction histidine kinase/ligand-binding sensor domain-containing protein